MKLFKRNEENFLDIESNWGDNLEVTEKQKVDDTIFYWIKNDGSDCSHTVCSDNPLYSYMKFGFDLKNHTGDLYIFDADFEPENRLSKETLLLMNIKEFIQIHYEQDDDSWLRISKLITEYNEYDIFEFSKDVYLVLMNGHFYWFTLHDLLFAININKAKTEIEETENEEE